MKIKDIEEEELENEEVENEEVEEIEEEVEERTIEGRLKGETGDLNEFKETKILSRQKRLIPTEIVYDQSYPIPESDIPFADNGLGQ